MHAKPRTAALFPGQGCSLEGTRELVLAHCEELYALARELLDADPFEQAGTSTRYAQPAIFLASTASWKALHAQAVDADAFAGHSLGELSALTAAGVWSDEQGLRLVVLRAELMAAAASGTEGGMLALLKGDLEVAGELAKRLGVTVANDNSIGQVVLSGPTAALSEVAQLARERGLRAIALDVSGAFHSPAMRPAVEPFREQLHRVVRRPPSAPVYSALTAEPFVDVAGQLSAAVCAPVRWRETMLSLDRAGLERYIDVGPDVVLARLSARNLPGREALGAEELGVPA